MKVIKNKRGFTLIELVIVLIIIAILAVVAIPRFRDLAGHARDASERAAVTAVRQAITIYRAYNELNGITPRFPFRLDPVTGSAAGVSATDAAPFFTFIMEPGGAIVKGWVKLDNVPAAVEGRYRGPNLGIYTYEATDGTFLRVP